MDKFYVLGHQGPPNLEDLPKEARSCICPQSAFLVAFCHWVIEKDRDDEIFPPYEIYQVLPSPQGWEVDPTSVEETHFFTWEIRGLSAISNLPCGTRITSPLTEIGWTEHVHLRACGRCRDKHGY
jgi:hypothetical protein